MRWLRLLAVAAPIACAACAASAGELQPWTGGAPPALALKDLEGREHRLSDYRGKVVVLNFWATWCVPCREEMPSLQRLHERLAGKPFAILAVDFGEGEAKIRAFLRQVPVRFPILLDRDAGVAGAWKVRVLPTTLVIGRDQRIRFSVVGDLEWDSPPVEDAIRTLLGPAAPLRAATPGHEHLCAGSQPCAGEFSRAAPMRK